MGCESSHFVFVFLINPKIRQTTVIFSFLPTKVNNCRHFVFFIIKGITPFCILIKAKKSSKRRPFCFFTSPKSRLTAAILFLYNSNEPADRRHFVSSLAQRADWQPPFCFFMSRKSRLIAAILFLYEPKEPADSRHFVSSRAQRADWQPPFCFFTCPKSRLTATILFLYEPKEQTGSRHFVWPTLPPWHPGAGVQEDDKLKKVVSRGLAPVLNDLDSQLKECQANCGNGEYLPWLILAMGWQNG